MERVKEILELKRSSRDVVIYGAGEAGELMFDIMHVCNIPVAFFTDRRFEQFVSYGGAEVLPKTKLNPALHFPIINPSSNKKTVKSIKDDLMTCGYQSGDWFLWDDDVNFDIVLGDVRVGKRTLPPKTFLRSGIQSFLHSVGRYTSINANLQIAYNHYIGLSTSFRVPNDRIQNGELTEQNRMKIGNDVYIGANVFINASKVREIGDGAIIGSGAVVLEDVPPYAVVAGVPAKIKKYRFTQDQIRILETVQWWNFDDKTLAENAESFTCPDLFFERFG